jgi:hypothetical protein
MKGLSDRSKQNEYQLPKNKITQMIKITFFFAFAFIFLAGCNKSANTKNGNNERQNVARKIKPTKKSGSLKEIIGDNILIMEQVNGIRKMKEDTTKKYSFTEFSKYLKIRDSLFVLLASDKKLIKCIQESSQYDEEFRSLGIEIYHGRGENNCFYKCIPYDIYERTILTLEEIIGDNKLIMEQLNGLKNMIANRSKINSLADIEKTLRMRDSLIVLLNKDEKFNKIVSEDFCYQKLEEEFKSLGIYIIQAEGLYFGLDIAPILDEVIERVADEPYILRNKIRNLNSMTRGGEYPYEDISQEMEIVVLSEKMLNKYPGHEYNKEILELLCQALNCLTEVHKKTLILVNSDDNKYAGTKDFFFIGNYNADFYPCITDTSYHQDFIRKYSKSRFAKVIKKIFSNISALSYPDSKILYIIKVPPLTSDSVFADERLKQEFNNLPKEIAEQEDCFKYMWLGIDIPHLLYLSNGKDTKKVICYRFFDSREPAEKRLKLIRKLIPSAKLVKYKLPITEKKNDN